ncbi:MAG: hypothetical protein H7222_00595 [Methylotenera sp.]|nr:hypothetical protein [Oligoflexia bacterium]
MNSSLKNLVFAIGSVLLLSAPAFAHPEDGRVGVELESANSVQAGKIHLSFDLVDLVAKKLLTDQDVSVSREMKIHGYVYDSALKEFKHVHPEYRDGVWGVDVELPVNGDYRFWASGVLASDQEEFKGSVKLKVSGGLPANLPTELSENRTGADGNSVIEVSVDPIQAKKPAMLMLMFSRNDKTTPVITPYLGAMAHVTTVPDDGDSLIHVHPMETDSKDLLMLHAEFPEAGNYRMWVQFIDGDSLKTVALTVTVNE